MAGAFKWAEPTAILANSCFTGFLILLSASDLKWKLLPHPFNDLFILSGLLFCFFFKSWPLSPFQSASALLFFGALMIGLERFFPDGLGGGDVKMIAGIAAWMGFSKAFLAVVLAFGLGALAALRLMLAGRATRKSFVPFGPFLAAGSCMAWFFGEKLNLWAQVDHGDIF